MNKQDFQRIVAAAKAGEGKVDQIWALADLINDNIERDRKPTVTLLAPAAALLRYQCQFLNGDWDVRELDNTFHWFKRAGLQIVDFPEATR